jgi:hypothetical protein
MRSHQQVSIAFMVRCAEGEMDADDLLLQLVLGAK